MGIPSQLIKPGRRFNIFDKPRTLFLSRNTSTDCIFPPFSKDRRFTASVPKKSETTYPYTAEAKISIAALQEARHFQLSPEVKEALYSKKPVVALETTIYTHGFPYPDNVALALDLESIVRQNGGVPATIGVLEGVAKVGMTTEELRRITAAAGNPDTMKISRRDLPYILGLVGCAFQVIQEGGSFL